MTVAPNQEVVDLLLTGMVPDKTSSTGLRHNDGSEYTPEERELVGQAGIAELMAAADAQREVAARLDRETNDLARVTELMEPYVQEHGEQLTVAEARELMTPDERAELDELGERLAAA